jgi:hypothetical protein
VTPWQQAACCKHPKQPIFASLLLLLLLLPLLLLLLLLPLLLPLLLLPLLPGSDPPGIKLRAAKALEAVDYFVPGYWVFSKLIQSLSDIGYDNNNLVGAGTNITFPAGIVWLDCAFESAFVRRSVQHSHMWMQGHFEPLSVPAWHNCSSPPTSRVSVRTDRFHEALSVLYCCSSVAAGPPSMTISSPHAGSSLHRADPSWVFASSAQIPANTLPCSALSFCTRSRLHALLSADCRAVRLAAAHSTDAKA